MAAEPEHRQSCAFCGLVPEPRVRLVAGPGIAICEYCVAQANAILHQPVGAVSSPSLGPAWQHMTDVEILDHLPEISTVSLRIDEQLLIWVRAARERGISWSRIGEALKITRQSAWERFSERI